MFKNDFTLFYVSHQWKPRLNKLTYNLNKKKTKIKWNVSIELCVIYTLSDALFIDIFRTVYDTHFQTLCIGYVFLEWSRGVQDNF